jgi:flagellar protein FlaI
VWHKEFDTLKTNLIFTAEKEIEDFVMKQVHRAGKHTSAAFPLTDVTLPGKHRLAIYYRKEVTLFGTSFTIRKFREDPLTVIDLVKMGTIDETVATYFWLLMENKLSMMVLGSTGAGKTTTLNAICCLIQPTNKICSIEEVSEINLPHENWVALISRSGFGLESQGEITLFDLIKSSLRHRPDFIVVGEVRGEESYVLFQALATGHGGLCTMHADNVNSAIKRLVQKPMDIAPGNISLMNCAAVVKKVRLLSNESSLNYLGSGRRMVQVSEITGPDTVRDIFTWNPVTDTFEADIMSSQILHKIAADNGFIREELLDEFERRKVVIGWMAEKDIRDFRSVSRTLAAYYRDPDSIFEKAADSLGL